MQRIPLGIYDLHTAKEICDKFKEQRNKCPERSENRLNAHILQRARGNRAIYKRVKNLDGSFKFERICNSNDDIPLKYAQRVSLYLIIK